MVNIKFKGFWVFVVLIAISNNTYSSLNDKGIIASVVDACAESKPVYLWEKYVQMPINRSLTSLIGIGEALASEEYQLLGKEAQNALGIPEDKQIAIRKIDPTNIMIEVIPVAFSMPEAIYFNEKNLKDKPFGIKRCAAFVEAVRKKYNQAGAQSLISVGTLITMCTLIYKATRLERNNLIKAIAIIGTIIGGGLVSKSCLRYFTYRAEVEGHYATKCYLCVQESAAFREHESINNPYALSKVILDEIAQDLKNQEQLCSCHKNNQ